MTNAELAKEIVNDFETWSREVHLGPYSDDVIEKITAALDAKDRRPIAFHKPEGELWYIEGVKIDQSGPVISIKFPRISNADSDTKITVLEERIAKLRGALEDLAQSERDIGAFIREVQDYIIRARQALAEDEGER